MSGLRDKGFGDRLNTAEKARKAMLERVRAKPGADDPAVAERKAARQAVSTAREARLAEREAAKLARQIRETAEREASQAARVASEIIDRTTAVAADQVQATSNLLDQAPQYVQAIARSNRILARGAGTIALEWFGLRQERLLKNLDAVNDLLACRSMPDLVSLQGSLVRQNVEQMIGNSQRLAQISAQVAQEATQTIMARSGRHRHTS